LRHNRELASKKFEEELKKKQKAASAPTESMIISDSSSVCLISPVPAPAEAGAMEVDDEEAALQAALAMSVDGTSSAQAATTPPVVVTEDSGFVITPDIPAGWTGTYELHGIVTHKGRDADSGHYIGWVRQSPGSRFWWKYDDDKVSETNTEEIMTLKGGGDKDMAYLVFYRAKL
jgi:hypothetical protein